MQEKIPKVGVGAIIKKGNKILLGKRMGSHGAGTWALPGGHLEFGETSFTCAKREIAEEIGIKIKNLKIGTFTEDYFKKEDKHYVTIYVIADYASGVVKVLEPEKCERFDWFSWDKLPSPLFIPLKNLKQTKFNPFKK